MGTISSWRRNEEIEALALEKCGEAQSYRKESIKER